MDDALSLRQLEPLLTQGRSQGRGARPGLTACSIAGIAAGMLVLGIVLSQVPDLIRYFRMSSM